jgi:hypothetical protein
MGIARWRGGWRVLNEHLAAAENEHGLPGVTRETLGQELAWQQGATSWQRLRRVLNDLMGWIS